MRGEDVLVASLLEALARSGIDPKAWAAAWARLLPSVLLIPAFGLRGLPALGRVLFGFFLAGAVAPALGPIAGDDGAWLGVLGRELGAGLPVAVSTAAALWAATMTGDLVDELRDGEAVSSDGALDARGPLGVLFTLATSAAFLSLGGPARLADALSAAEPLGASHASSVAISLVRGIYAAIVVAAPLLAAAACFDVFRALLARLSKPASLVSAVAPLRSLVLVVLTALLLDHMLGALVEHLDAALPGG